MSHLPPSVLTIPCALSVKEHTRRRQNPPVEAESAGNRRQDGVPTARTYGRSFALRSPALMEEVSPWLDVFTADEIARAAAVDVRDVRALVANGRLPTIDGRFVAAAHAVEVVRTLRSGSALPAAVPELFQPALAQHREPGVPLAGSALAHAVILGAFALLIGAAPVVPRSQRFDTTSLVFLATPGPGGGGGGGGLKQPAPPPRAELQGASPMRSPVVTAARRPRPQDGAAARASTGSHAGAEASGASASGTEAGASSASRCTRRDASRRTHAIARGFRPTTPPPRTAAARAPRAA